MANIDAAFGLRPYNMLGEGVNSNGIQKFKIQLAGTAGTSSVIYQGTPVIPLANGLIDIVGAAAGGALAADNTGAVAATAATGVATRRAEI